MFARYIGRYLSNTDQTNVKVKGGGGSVEEQHYSVDPLHKWRILNNLLSALKLAQLASFLS